MNFEWDNKKAKSNLKKHRVSFEEAETILLSALAYNAQERPQNARAFGSRKGTFHEASGRRCSPGQRVARAG